MCAQSQMVCRMYFQYKEPFGWTFPFRVRVTCVHTYSSNQNQAHDKPYGWNAFGSSIFVYIYDITRYNLKVIILFCNFANWIHLFLWSIWEKIMIKSIKIECSKWHRWRFINSNWEIYSMDSKEIFLDLLKQVR